MKLKLKKGLVLLMLCALVLGMGIDASAEEVTSDLQEMFNYVNNFRTGSDAWYVNPDGTRMNCTGLTALRYDSQLQDLAMVRAHEIVEKFSHERPSGGTIVDGKTVNAENIAYGEGSLGTAASIFAAWQETDKPFSEVNGSGQGHRRNMLGVMANADGTVDNWTIQSIGIGHVREGGTDYWVQLFGDSVSWDPSEHIKAAETSTPTPTPTPTGTPAPTPTGTPDPGPTGTPTPTGTPDPLPTGTPDPRPTGTPDPLPTGVPDPRPTGTPDPLPTGTPDPRPTGTPTPSGSGSTASKNDTTTKQEYKVKSGAGSVWTKGSGQALTITTDGDFKKFFSVAIDGAVIDKSNYDAWSGSTVVSLKPAFLETLAAGEHTYRVYYTDGQVDTTFKVEGATSTQKQESSSPTQTTSTTQASNTTTGNKAPKTGDNTTAVMAVIMMLVSAAGLALSLKARKRV